MTSTDVEVVRPDSVSVQLFDQPRLQLLKDQICPTLSDGEMELFAEVCQRVNLDPFARQIYAVKRWNGQQKREVMTVQTSIDGFRLIAQRTGEYAGQAGPHWCGPDGRWVDVWLSAEPPAAARVGALRRGFAEPLWAVARFDAYAQRKKDGALTQMWGSMPDLMIAKCAEAQALRRAFPQELSGLYTGDEMAQADAREAPTAGPLVPSGPPRLSPANVERVTHACEDAGAPLAAIVRDATDGRTEDVTEAYASEVPALRKALADWQAQQTTAGSEPFDDVSDAELVDDARYEGTEPAEFSS